ncbi:MAG: 16S rRNA (adenine(1518)-N(6)/adenine(1519)-N(6))-dimethyltransferase RsmA [Chloroflexi bacterium]|nr:16S rRNA (adenine(1518)-N(6)/adenine(1519)-N(6))-dimethyltransferase RsmA [Chloroflexota bacterium]
MKPRSLLEEHDISPKKSLGQNFLHDPNTLEKIITTAELMPDDVVLEIGAGTGLLTERLAQAVRRVVAVEVDERLKPILDQVIAPFPNVTVIYQDFLTVNVADLFKPEPYIVVANVPYYITSAILRHLLETDHRPQRLVLTVQEEVAERLVAQPDDMSILSVSVQFYGRPQIATRLNRAVFWPRPDVDSAVVRIDTYDQPPVDVPDEKTFFRVVRAGFGQKRKQLKNSISAGLGLKAEDAAALLVSAGIEPRRRAETLALAEWAALARAYAGWQQ